MEVNGNPGGIAVRIHQGDRAAETELVERYSRGVRAIVQRSLSDKSFVEDVCQDVLALAIQKIRKGDLNDPERLSGFIAAIARNLSIEHGRRNAARLPAQWTEPASEPSQFEDLARRERARIIRQVLEELGSERDRDVLRGFYLLGESRESLCARFGLTAIHFNRVLFRARERYRELYKRLG